MPVTVATFRVKQCRNIHRLVGNQVVITQGIVPAHLTAIQVLRAHTPTGGIVLKAQLLPVRAGQPHQQVKLPLQVAGGFTFAVRQSDGRQAARRPAYT
ncbi:hypothetical protein WH357_01890 [Enterobacter ludwigii]